MDQEYLDRAERMKDLLECACDVIFWSDRFCPLLRVVAGMLDVWVI